ncbi:MAG: MBL fold metallo-hydrolase [Pirellulales bacterium]
MARAYLRVTIRWQRKIAWTSVLLALSLAMSLAFTAQGIAGPTDERLDVYWIDVEGGAATLLVTPAGETVLIDSGNPGRRDADRIVQVVTQVAGRRQIDHLVTTHFHGDHYGGAATLSGLLPIKTVYDNGEFEGMPDRPDPSYWKFACERRVVLNPGDSIPVKQSAASGATPLSIRCLGTRQQFVSPLAEAASNSEICASVRSKNRDGSDNANSVVLIVSFGDWRFFDAGDLTWNQESRLVCPQNLVGVVDVYQVTHHGLDASNNPVVLQSIRPRVAIMNNGVTKGCMPEVFETLKQTQSLAAIYQVHKNLRPDGATNNVEDPFIANRERECRGNFIRLSVAPDAKTYSVAIPANEHERTFETVAK